jgi:ABC-type sugar transport system ATPase subunit
MSATPALELKGIEKHYPGTVAVRFRPGEKLTFEDGHIHALVGQNGAGKSTLVSLIAGLQKPTTGDMFLRGEPYAPANVGQARRSGVDIVLQEPLIEEHMSVEENLLLGREARYARHGLFNPRTRRRFAEAAMARLPRRIDLKARAGDLPIESQKLIEMARALVLEPKLLIVDELSAAMSARGVKDLEQTLREFAAGGGLVIYISHHLDEVVDLCDRVTILRDGTIVTTLEAKQTNKQHISELMVGNDVEESAHRSVNEDAAPVLELKSLSVPGQCTDISLVVRPGEVVGIGGLMDSGAAGVALAVFGMIKPSSGSVELNGTPVRFRSPTQAVSAGVAYVPADRDREGLFLNMRIDRNIDLASMSWTSMAGFLDPRRSAATANKFIKRLDIRCRGCRDIPLNLSGGNRQKVAIAKWLVRDNRLLILHNPTRGVDIGGRSEIHAVINELADRGAGILLISDDLHELIALSDTIVTMRRGAVSAQMSNRAKPTEKELIGHML